MILPALGAVRRRWAPPTPRDPAQIPGLMPIEGRETAMPSSLRFLTYLAPSIPLEFFADVVQHIEREVGLRCELRFETSRSGPGRDDPDPFSSGQTDVGFMCSPSFLWLRDREPPAVELVPAAPVFNDPRVRGKSLYFADVIVRREQVAQSFLELAGSRWAYNDACSLSGYFSVLSKLSETGVDGHFFEEFRATGSHLNSMELVGNGEVDAAAIDSHALALNLRSSLRLRKQVRVLESWGPYPAQPVVARASLDRELKQHLAQTLLQMGQHARMRSTLSAYGIERFTHVTEAFYDRLRQTIRQGESLRDGWRRKPAGSMTSAVLDRIADPLGR